jgi:hypothetical protein
MRMVIRIYEDKNDGDQNDKDENYYDEDENICWG